MATETAIFTVGATQLEVDAVMQFSPTLDNELERLGYPEQGQEILYDYRISTKEYQMTFMLRDDADKASFKFWKLWNMVDLCAQVSLTVKFTDQERTFTGGVKNLTTDFQEGIPNVLICTCSFWEDDIN